MFAEFARFTVKTDTERRMIRHAAPQADGTGSQR